jgi:flagellar hook-associated protein 1 FlgK
MRSTFMGLETARRGMFTQQSALYTTGHNISNANTPGYSRQRINFTQTTPYPSVGMNRPQLPGQMGTGVEAGSVQRIRESFLDVQFRTENTKMGYYGAMSESLTKMEEIMNHPKADCIARSRNFGTRFRIYPAILKTRVPVMWWLHPARWSLTLLITTITR